MPRATYLRYGRRGGGWVPEDRKRETMHPHRQSEEWCPNAGCRGRVIVPDPRPTTPFTIVCDSMWPHTHDVTPLDWLLAQTASRTDQLGLDMPT